VTPRLSRTAVTAFIAAVTLGLAPSAFAASEQDDAGDLLATAQDLGGGSVTLISGSFASAADADLYRVCLTNGTSFSASTVNGTTPTNADTQLFLFDSDGHGVYANDDAPGTRNSRLPANHRFSPGSGGEYYLGVSPYNHDPQSAQGEIFLDNYSRLQYPDDVLDASGFGGAGSLASWNGRWPGGPGTYRITVTGTTVCDTTAPTIELRTPAKDARVRQGADVVVDYSCSDEGGSGLASCVGSVPDGAKLDTSSLGELSVTVSARDGAGNQTVVTHTVAVVDERPPEVTLDSPVDGAVYERGELVAADYSCADEDGGSGLESCAGPVADGASVDTTTLGDHTFTVDARDRSGNVASATARYTVVDRTPPTIAVTTPAAGASYALGEEVLADYSCADEVGGSGVASCAGQVANGAAVDTSSSGEKSFTVEATDAAGNPASVTVRYTVVDRTAPAIELSAPVDGATYERGQRVVAAYYCTDQKGGSGVATCEGTVASGAPIDTSRPGVYSFQVRTADVAGNAGSRTVTYNVGYHFDGFLKPVDNLPNANRWKAGVPVQIRFSLDGYQGARPEAAGYPQSVRCGGGDADVVARAAKKRPVFHYERRSDRYTLLWKTDRKWAGSCRDFVLKLDDGTVHTARFQFVKH
jgi:hypothetical protein